MSRWTLDNETARILKQDDFWDSANLINGSYRRVSLLGAVTDVLGQIFGPGELAPDGARVLPYEVLRRSKGYEVRRYPAHSRAVANFTLDKAGLSRLSAYTRGRNAAGEAVTTALPIFIQLPDANAADADAADDEADDGDGPRAVMSMVLAPADQPPPPEPAAQPTPAGDFSGEFDDEFADAFDAFSQMIDVPAIPDAPAPPAPPAFPEPIPADKVEVVEVPPRVVAVDAIRAEWNDATIIARAREIAALAERDGLATSSASAPAVGVYNSELIARVVEVHVLLDYHPWAADPGAIRRGTRRP